MAKCIVLNIQNCIEVDLKNAKKVNIMHSYFYQTSSRESRCKFSLAFSVIIVFYEDTILNNMTSSILGFCFVFYTLTLISTTAWSWLEYLLYLRKVFHA